MVSDLDVEFIKSVIGKDKYTYITKSEYENIVENILENTDLLSDIIDYKRRRDTILSSNNDLDFASLPNKYDVLTEIVDNNTAHPDAILATMEILLQFIEDDYRSGKIK